MPSGFYFIFILLVSLSYSVALKLSNNGYEEVIVGIESTVPEIGAIVSALRTQLTAASSVLFTATKNRAYFKTIKILIPPTWTTYQAEATATTESYSNMDFRIAPVNTIYGHEPYTIQPGICGIQGTYIHITPEYLTDESVGFAKWGVISKILVHEWAKYRWGVFDEMGYPGDTVYPVFYKDGETVKPNYCTNADLNGGNTNSDKSACTTVSSTGLPNSDCRFIPNINGNPTITSSLLGIPNLASVTQFCDSSTHNAKTKTKHNAKCNSKSVWDVMLLHEDFKNDANPAGSVGTVTITTVREADATYCFVIDKSTAMDTSNRKLRASKAIKNFIKNEAAIGTSIAIVLYDETATVAKTVTKIEDEATRSEIVTAIDITPTKALRCIECGLQTAVQQAIVGVKKAEVILVASGADTQSGTAANMQQYITSSGVSLTIINMGDSVYTDLDTVASNTQGNLFLVSDTDIGPVFDNFLRSRLLLQPGVIDRLRVFEEIKTVPASGGTITGTFDVDASLGKNLRLVFQIVESTASFGFPVAKGPSGTSPNDLDISLLTNEKMIIVTVALAETGTWTWSLPVTTNAEAKLSVDVFAEQRDAATPTITVKSWANDAISDLTNPFLYFYCEVKKGDYPILKATVKVNIISSDGATSIEKTLLDDGAGNDITSGDGIYTYSLPGTELPMGTYTTSTVVTADSNTVINTGSGGAVKRKRREITNGYGFQLMDILLRRKRTIPVDPTDSVYKCCGSSLDATNTSPTGTFTRSSQGTATVPELPTTTTVSTTTNTATSTTTTTPSTTTGTTPTSSSTTTGTTTTGSSTTTGTTTTGSSTSTGTTTTGSSTTTGTTTTGSSTTTGTTTTVNPALTTTTGSTTTPTSTTTNTGSTTTNTASTTTTNTATTTTGSTTTVDPSITTTTGPTTTTNTSPTTTNTASTTTGSTTTTDPTATTTTGPTTTTTVTSTTTTTPTTTTTTTVITLIDLKTDTDVIRPSKVTGLSAVCYDDQTYAITFTTSGDDSTLNKSIAYEIRLDKVNTTVALPSTTVSQTIVILSFVQSVYQTHLIQDSGTNVIYKAPSSSTLDTSVPYYATIVALDDSANYGDVSDIVSFQCVAPNGFFTAQYWLDTLDEINDFFVYFWPWIEYILKIILNIVYDVMYALLIGSTAGVFALIGVAIYMGGQDIVNSDRFDPESDSAKFGLKKFKGAGDEDFVFVWA